jgi:hypothetical protein
MQETTVRWCNGGVLIDAVQAVGGPMFPRSEVRVFSEEFNNCVI